ncbi:hypothetical protein VTN00DRAFT_2267 [Thermoascus crustaceus]|uniref:uncharacterized protein n=1 Tax=Thermoascus crustaceus TaxID=5088 RepID=UPI0037423EE5
MIGVRDTAARRCCSSLASPRVAPHRPITVAGAAAAAGPSSRQLSPLEALTVRQRLFVPTPLRRASRSLARIIRGTPVALLYFGS